MGQPTQKESDVFLILVAGGIAAAVVAVLLGYVAHFNFGLSREQIRTPAVLGAVIVAVLMAVEFFRKRPRKP